MKPKSRPGPTWHPEATSGVDFGSPWSFLPGSKRKRKAQAQRAKSQGQQAARPQGLKDSEARRDVRSTLIRRPPLAVRACLRSLSWILAWP